MSAAVRIYEPIYDGNPTVSSPLFEPWDITHYQDGTWREFRILVDMYKAGLHRKGGLTGLFSPKFSLKTQVSANEFQDFASRHGDSDVVFINPFPQIRYWSYNVWMQGAHAHPGLVPVAQALLDAVGIGWDLHDVPRHGPATLCYCNFWVGSEAFWEAYVGKYLMPIAEYLESNPEQEAAKGVLRRTQHTDPAPFLPFVIERLFSTFLSLNPSFKSAAWSIEGEQVKNYCLDDFERILLRNLQGKIDAADAAGQFDETLIEFMNFMGELFQQHHYEYYAVEKHPHSGRAVDRYDSP